MYAVTAGGGDVKMGRRKVGRGNGGRGDEGSEKVDAEGEGVVERRAEGRRVRRYLISLAMRVERARVAGSYVGARTGWSAFSSKLNSSALRVSYCPYSLPSRVHAYPYQSSSPSRSRIRYSYTHLYTRHKIAFHLIYSSNSNCPLTSASAPADVSAS